MANVLHRINKLYLNSVNTPEYDIGDWIINPNISAVEGIASCYWVINPDDTISPMPESDRLIVDQLSPYRGCSDIASAHQIKVGIVNELRDTFLNGGWTYNGVIYDSDPISVQNIAGTMTAINAGYFLPPEFTWRTHDNQDISFTNQTFITFFMAASKWRELAYQTSWAHKRAINALTTIPDIAAYDFTQGWVKGFVLTQNGLQPVM